MISEESERTSRLISIENPLNNYSNYEQITPSKPEITLYKAYDNNRKQHVFIKVFSKSVLAEVLYQREKAILCKLDHENIVKLIEAVDCCPSIFDSSTVSFFAVEFAHHSDLFNIIAKGGAMKRDLTRTLFKKILNAVQNMHSQSLAHLDLKLENLLIDSKYELKLCDFDLSQEIASSANIAVASGTPNWRSPELKSGLCKDFKAADVYSLGVILFVILTGIPPYTEVNCGAYYKFDGRYQVLQTNPARFWDAYSKMTGDPNFYEEEFKNLINAMLNENPEARPSIEDVAAHPWMKGRVLSDDEYEHEMKCYLEKDQVMN